MANLISEAVSTIKNWWLILILGILLLIGGIWVAAAPVQSYLALSVLFIVLLLVNGIMQIIFSISNKDKVTGWGWMLAGGILEFLIGIYLWSNPHISAAMLPFVVGFWLLFRGVSIIAHSTDLKGEGIKGWGWLLTLGILMTLLSFFMIMDPVFGAFNVVYLTSFAMIFFGIAYIMFSFTLKKIKSKTIDVVNKAKGGIDDLEKSVMDYLDKVDPGAKEKVSQAFKDYKAQG